MKNQSWRDKAKPHIRALDRAAEAARDPGPGASNRPGFDLGGAVGDVKPDDDPPRGARRDASDRQREASDSHIKVEGEANRRTGKSAVAGVLNWLRGK